MYLMDYESLQRKIQLIGQSVEILPVPLRVKNALNRNGVFKIEELLQYKDAEVKKFIGLGVNGYYLVTEALLKLGLRLKGE